jgi:hypothetical protein
MNTLRVEQKNSFNAVRTTSILGLSILACSFLSPSSSQSPESSQDPKPSHYGVFFEKDGELIELQEQEIYDIPVENQMSNVQTFSDSRPTFIVWRSNTNLDYLEFLKLNQYLGQSKQSISYNATPKDDGIIEITPKSSLDGGVYCLIQGDPLAVFLSGWCFQVGAINQNQTSPTVVINDTQAPTQLATTVAEPLSNSIDISSLAFSPQSPASLRSRDVVHVSFRYSTIESNGVRIWVQPMTNGDDSPNYMMHGSPIYPMGEGEASGWFTFENQTVIVDQIRIEMYSSDGTTFITEYYFDVNYSFSP